MYPALAVADAVRTAQTDARITLLGPAGSDYNQLIDRTIFEFATVPSSSLIGVSTLDRIRAPGRLAASVIAAGRLLRRARVDLVIGFGTSASSAAVLAARTLGLRTAIHEANAVPGLANALVGRFVDRVYLGVAGGPGWWRRASRARTVGTPIRAGIGSLVHVERSFPAGRSARVLVAGGGRGAAFVAREIPGLLAEVKRRGVPCEVWHQTAADLVDGVRRAYDAAGVASRVTPYIDDMTGAYRWADFVVARGGAGMTSELASAGLPGLLVPWADAACDHQSANARAFTSGGAGIWTREAEWSVDRVADHVAALLSNGDRWRRASSAARLLARPDAAALIAADALSLIAGGR